MRLDLFFAKISKRDDGCWLWTAARTTHGYGLWTDCTPPRRTWQAHRLMWVLGHGPIAAGLCVCHSCDNPSCVNPAHLWLGTPLDNARDKVAKGRMRRGDFLGEANGRAVLTEAKVRAIRRRLGEGETGVALAREYGVSQMTISDIRRRARWRHVA